MSGEKINTEWCEQPEWREVEDSWLPANRQPHTSASFGFHFRLPLPCTTSKRVTVHGSDTFSDRFANKGLHTLPGHASGEIEANEGCEKLNSTARIDLTLVVLGLVGLPSIHQTPRSPSASFSRHHQPHGTCGESVPIAGEETLLAGKAHVRTNLRTRVPQATLHKLIRLFTSSEQVA